MNSKSLKPEFKKLLIVIALTASVQSYAQWDGSAVNTFTNSNVGIGLGPVFDARMHLLTNSDPSALLPGSSSNDIIPGFLIQRNAYTNGTMGGQPKNIMEIWRQEFTGPGGVTAFTPGPNELKVVVDHEGNMGIGRQPYTQLDMTRDANIDGTLTVGNVAGSSSAVDALTVKGNISFVRPLDGQYRNLRAHTSDGALAFLANTGGEDGPAIVLNGKTNTTSTPGAIVFSCYGTGGNKGFEFNNYDPSVPQWNSLVRISTDGKMSIGAPGMTTPAGYKLYVQEGILTEKLKVALHTTGDWADYVFADDYQLKSLEEVGDYIQKNKHLPGVPSAEEVCSQGLDVAKMDAKLLEKIEELTIYLIELKKDNKRLQERIDKIENN